MDRTIGASPLCFRSATLPGLRCAVCSVSPRDALHRRCVLLEPIGHGGSAAHRRHHGRCHLDAPEQVHPLESVDSEQGIHRRPNSTPLCIIWSSTSLCNSTTNSTHVTRTTNGYPKQLSSVVLQRGKSSGAKYRPRSSPRRRAILPVDQYVRSLARPFTSGRPEGIEPAGPRRRACRVNTDDGSNHTSLYKERRQTPVPSALHQLVVRYRDWSVRSESVEKGKEKEKWQGKSGPRSGLASSSMTIRPPSFPYLSGQSTRAEPCPTGFMQRTVDETCLAWYGSPSLPADLTLPCPGHDPIPLAPGCAWEQRHPTNEPGVASERKDGLI